MLLTAVSDIVGCGVDFVARTAFFTKNGKSEGKSPSSLCRTSAEQIIQPDFRSYLCLGRIFTVDGDDLFPMVGMKSSGDSIRANFGHAPFKYDITAYVREQRNTVWRHIQESSVLWVSASNAFQPLSSITSEIQAAIADGEFAREKQANKIQENTRKAMDDIVMDYLSHHGYSKTAEALRAGISDRRPAPFINISPPSALPSSKSSTRKSSIRNGNTATDGDTVMTSITTPPSPIGLPASISDTTVTIAGSAQDISSREQIRAAIISGNIDFALREMKDRYPEALNADGGWLLFRLKSRKFVELALEAAAALKVAKKVQAQTFEDQEAIPAAASSSSFSNGGGVSVANGARRFLDKGKGRSQNLDMPPPSSPRPSFAAPMPIKRSPSHARSSHHLLHQPMVGEIEEEEDDDAMDIDDDEDEEHRVVQNALLSGTPSSSSPPSFANTPPRPISSQVTSSHGNGASNNGNGRTQPIGFSRPFIPVSSTSSSPSSTPPTSLSNPHAIPINIPSASSRPTISNLVTASPASSSFAVKQVTMAMSPAAQVALNDTLHYGKLLHAEYVSNERPDVQDLFKRTLGLAAYESPLEAGGEVSKLAGQEDRDDLARSINVAILGQLCELHQEFLISDTRD